MCQVSINEAPNWSKNKKTVKMTPYYNVRRHYVGMMTSPKIFCHVTSICKVSFFYLTLFKRYDNLRFGNVVSKYDQKWQLYHVVWIQNLSKMWITKCCTLSQSSMLIAYLYFKSYQKKYFGRVVNYFTHDSLLSSGKTYFCYNYLWFLDF